MEDLEEQCIEKLNKLLYNYGLKIIYTSVLSNLFYDYYLYDEINRCHIYKWTLFDNILFNHDSYDSLFYKLHQYYKDYVYLVSIQPQINKKINQQHIWKRYADAYDNIKHLENSSCLEEIIIKMDLMGI
jgi:hypothetical protein